VRHCPTTLCCSPLAPKRAAADAQRRPVPRAGWVRTIHHGLPEQLLTPQPVRPTYFAFLGRISPKHRPQDRGRRGADKYVCQVAGDVAGCADDILDNDRDPSSSESLSARMRAMTSAAVPAVKPQRERLFDFISRAMVSER
jgi:hypothetical protein